MRAPVHRSLFLRVAFDDIEVEPRPEGLPSVLYRGLLEGTVVMRQQRSWYRQSRDKSCSRNRPEGPYTSLEGPGDERDPRVEYG